MELFQLVRALADRDGLAVALITHHVNLAARFADRVLLLSGGRPAGDGTPGDVLTRETGERVFAWPVSIAPFEGRPQGIPPRKGHPRKRRSACWPGRPPRGARSRPAPPPRSPR